MLPTKLRFIWPIGFRGEEFFRNQPIGNKNGLWWPCLLTDRDEMSNLYRGPSKDASYQVSVHLAMRFQRRRFLKIGQSETRMACGKRTFHRCFLICFGSFGHAVSEEKINKNRPVRNKNGLWWPRLLMDRDKMSNLYRGPSIDASHKVSVHLAKLSQRRRFIKIS